MDFTEHIRQRREQTVQRALAMLENYESSDAATRATLLQVAEKALSDQRVATAWIAALAAETDQTQRLHFLTRLSKLDFRQIPADTVCTAHILDCLMQPDTREWALYCLSRLAPRDPRLVAPLIEAYRSQRGDRFGRRILATLIMLGDSPPELIEFFKTVLEEVDEEFKTTIVKRLLDQDALESEALEKLLALSEPSIVKSLLLDHLIDRSMPMDAPTIEILLHDADAQCRYAAAWALTDSGDVSPVALQALLQAAGSDADERVRDFVINAFEHTLSKTSDAIESLLAMLRTEISNERAAVILKLLAPHVYRDEQIVPALLAMLEKNLNTEIALQIYELLGVLAASNERVREALLAAFEREKEDRIKAAILRPLSKIYASDPRISKLCAAALKLPDPALKQWGLQGVLMLPLTPENAEAIAGSVGVLLAPEIPLDLRVRLAHKLALLPQKSVELLSALQKTAAQSRDSEVRRICEEVGSNALNDQLGAVDEGDVSVDWPQWLHRAEVEHRGDGIFPAMYEQYDNSPASARRVLKALLNPQCSDNLYSQYGYSVSEHTILALLAQKNAIDDDVSRFCVGRALTQDGANPDAWLQFLAANPTFGPLKENLWAILEKQKTAGAALLRSLFVAIYGSDGTAAEALAGRIEKVRGSSALQPYIRLITENLGWPPARELLIGLSEHSDLDSKDRDPVNEALEKFGIKPSGPNGEPVRKQEAGFADE